MNQKQNLKTALFAIFSLLGLLAAGFLVKRTLELRRGAAFGTISMGLYPAPLEICVGEEKDLSVSLNPVVGGDNYKISAAELRFGFDQDLATVSEVSFHQLYPNAIWNQSAANTSVWLI